MEEKLKEAMLIIINSISITYSEIRLSINDVVRLKEIAKELNDNQQN